jgi:hypothetical protein
MKATALKTFSGKFGLIRTGTVFECDPSYFKSLAKNGLVAETPERGGDAPAQKPEQPGPSKNRKLPDPPRQGKGQPGAGRTAPGVTVRPPAGGKGQASASLRADLASRATTSQPSVDGEKKPETSPDA